MVARSSTVQDRALVELAKRLRRHALTMTSRARSSHVGSCLSIADILAVLYGASLRIDPARPEWSDRDRLIVSKGHAAAITYAALAEAGFFPMEDLLQYGMNGTSLWGHVSHLNVPGVELSTGSLGHGLPVAAGMALVAKRSDSPWRVFVLLSDGECDEGSNWEASLFAAHHHLDNLVAIIDYNKIQSLDRVENTLGLEPLRGKFTAFGWEALELDGHEVPALCKAFSEIPLQSGKPTCIIAHTIKGKGITFMENRVLWHYRSPTPEELAAALRELDTLP